MWASGCHSTHPPGRSVCARWPISRGLVSLATIRIVSVPAEKNTVFCWVHGGLWLGAVAGDHPERRQLLLHNGVYASMSVGGARMRTKTGLISPHSHNALDPEIEKRKTVSGQWTVIHSLSAKRSNICPRLWTNSAPQARRTPSAAYIVYLAPIHTADSIHPTSEPALSSVPDRTNRPNLIS